MPPKNRTSVLMTLPPEFYSGHRDADQSLYWRSRRNSPLDLHRGQPAGARVPPRYSRHGGKRSLPAGRPVRPVYQQDQFRTREGYRGPSRCSRLFADRDLHKLNAVDPREWLADVLANLSDHPVHRIVEVRPWAWKARHDAAARVTTAAVAHSQPQP